MPARRNRPLFLIDIAVPRDIDADVQQLTTFTSTTSTTSQAIVRENVRMREQELSRCQEIIADRAREVMARFARRSAEVARPARRQPNPVSPFSAICLPQSVRVIENLETHSAHMKIQTAMKTTSAWLMGVTLLLVGVTITAEAAAPALNGQISLRPLTPSEIKDYGLPATSETSGGLSAVGVGQPAYLEALVNAAIAPSNIVSVVWTLTNKPIGSAAVLTNSPLGTNVPTYKMADRYNQKAVRYIKWLGACSCVRMSPGNTR